MRAQWAKVYFGCRRLQAFPTFLRVQLSVTPWTAAHQAPPSSSISRSLPKFMSIESVMLFNHLILCCLLLLLPSVFPSIRIVSNESALRIRWPKYWSLSFSNSPSNENRRIWSPCSPRSQDSSSTIIQKHSLLCCAMLCLVAQSHLTLCQAPLSMRIL